VVIRIRPGEAFQPWRVVPRINAVMRKNTAQSPSTETEPLALTDRDPPFVLDELLLE
jgi:hypothetical protein